MSRSRHNDRELRFAFLREPPFCYRLSNGSVTGCDVEVARHVIREIGIVSFMPAETEFAELLPGLEDGRWDMTTGLFITDERRRTVNFSRSIWALPDGLLVRSGSSHNISGYASIARESALRLGVVKDQVQHQTALHLEVPNERIHVFSTYAEAAAAVMAQTIDVYASVAMAHRGYLEQYPALQLKVVDVPVSEKSAEQGAFAFAKTQAELRGKVDDALTSFLGSPDHRALMVRFGFSPEQVNMIASTTR